MSCRCIKCGKPADCGEQFCEVCLVEQIEQENKAKQWFKNIQVKAQLKGWGWAKDRR